MHTAGSCLIFAVSEDLVNRKTGCVSSKDTVRGYNSFCLYPEILFNVKSFKNGFNDDIAVFKTIDIACKAELCLDLSRLFCCDITSFN